MPLSGSGEKIGVTRSARRVVGASALNRGQERDRPTQRSKLYPYGDMAS